MNIHPGAKALLTAVCLCAPMAAAQSRAPTSTVIDSLGRLVALRTDEAWRALRARGVPIIERIASDDAHRLVTFVWRGDSTTNNVVVVTPLTLMNFDASVMHRLGQTDLWVLSTVLPSDSRFLYRFAPNDNLVPFERDTNVFARFATMQRDTANPRLFDSGAFGTMSILELEAAPSDAVIARRADVATGTITRDSVRSTALGRARAIWVYTPSGFDATRHSGLPLLVVMDGEAYQALVPTPTILDNLIARQLIPPTIAVFVDNPQETREADLDCRATWGRFLATELVPWIERRYRTSHDPRRRVVAGSSLGALAATCAAIAHPSVFGNVIAQSGSFYRAPNGEHPEWVARHLAASGPLPIRFAITIGVFEAAAIPNRDPSMLTSSRHLRDVLTAKGYPLSYRELASGHEHVAWRATLGGALRELLGARAR